MFDQPDHTQTDPDTVDRRLWRIVGALAIAHVVLMLAGFTLQRISRLGEAPGTALATYRGSPLGAAGVGSAISLAGFVALLFAAPLLAQLLRGNTATTRWLSRVISGTASLYVGITLAVGSAASGAARYGAHHGLPASDVVALNTLHWFGVFVATAILGVFLLTVAARVWATGRLPRWVAVLGVVAGICCLAAAVNPPEDVVDNTTLVWMAWFVTLGVTALRGGRRKAARLPVPVASAA